MAWVLFRPLSDVSHTSPCVSFIALIKGLAFVLEGWGGSAVGWGLGGVNLSISCSCSTLIWLDPGWTHCMVYHQ